MSNVTVIDMGMGNIRSLVSALEFLGASYQVSNSIGSLSHATHLMLPGVGAFDAAMSKLNSSDLAEAIRREVMLNGKPILGICLGMQLLCSSSAEGVLQGLDLVPGRFERLKPDAAMGNKVPHVGFSAVQGHEPKGLFTGLEQGCSFYFTHSFALMVNQDWNFNTSYCLHTQPFVAAFQTEKICAVQFHPEKSQSTGLRLIRNFLTLIN